MRHLSTRSLRSRSTQVLLCLCLLLVACTATSGSDSLSSEHHQRALHKAKAGQTLDAALAAGAQSVSVTANISLSKPVVISSKATKQLAIKGGPSRPFVICGPGVKSVAILLRGVELTISNIRFTGCRNGLVQVSGPGASLSLLAVDVTGCAADKALVSVADGSLSVVSTKMFGNSAQQLLSFRGEAGSNVKITGSEFVDNQVEVVLSLNNTTPLTQLDATQLVPTSQALNTKGDTTKGQLVEVSISRCKFLQNTLDNQGWLLAAERMALAIDGCEFRSNEDFGGLISSHQGALELTNSEVLDNQGAPSTPSSASYLLRASEGRVGLAALRGCSITNNTVAIGIGLPAFTDYLRGFKAFNKTQNELSARLYSNESAYGTYARLLAAQQQSNMQLMGDKRDNPLVLENCTVSSNTFYTAGIYAYSIASNMGTAIRLTRTNFTNNLVEGSTEGVAAETSSDDSSDSPATHTGLVVVHYALLVMDRLNVHNNAAPSIFIVLQGLTNLTNSAFTNNSADGGWVLRATNVTAMLSNDTLTENQGLGILSVGKATLWMEGLNISRNNATSHVTEVFNASLALSPCSFERNQAGGAVLYFRDSYFSPMESFRFNRNKAGKAVFAAESFFLKFPQEYALMVQKTNFTDNRVNGSEAGAVLVGPRGNQWGRVKFANCSFSNNTVVPSNSTAQPTGAALSSQGLHTVVVDSCVFKNNAALVNASGGAIFTSTRMEINDTIFTNNVATWLGGAVACSGCPHLRIFNGTFSHNTAKGAGALMLASAGEKSDVEPWNRLPNAVADSTFINNSAVWDGNAEERDAGDDGSSDFNSNGVSCFPGVAGAVCVHPQWNTTMSNCSITNNRATWGGAMFINNGGLSGRAVCLLTLCTNTLSNNSISNGAGAAVFLTSVGSTVCQECSTNCTKAAENQGQFSKCSYWANNIAAAGSPSDKIIATGPLSLDVSSPNDYARTRSLTKRGAPINATVQLLDFYNETINYLLPYTAVLRVSHISQDQDEKVMVSRYKKVLSYITQYNMSQDAVMLGGDAQRNRSYELLFSIDGEESTQESSLEIKLRSCLPGERQIENVGCYDCEAYTFIQDPEIAECFQCPDGGDCIGRGRGNRGVLAPKENFWQSTPHSPDVHPCQLDSSCRGPGRANDDILRSFLVQNNDRFLRMWQKPPKGTVVPQGAAHGGRMLNVSEYRKLVAEYNELQCADGYTGNLCGVCKEGYGRWTNRCVKCISRPVNNLFVLLACLLVVALLAFTIFSHIKVAEQRSQLVLESADGLVQCGPNGTFRSAGGGTLQARGSTDSIAAGTVVVGDLGRDTDTPGRDQGTVLGRGKELRTPAVASRFRDSIESMAEDPQGRTKVKMLQSIAKIMISYVQVLSITRNVQLSWPSALRRFVSGFDFTSGPSNYIALDCSISSSLETKAYVRTISMACFPLVLAGLATIFWLFAAATRRGSARQDWSFRQYFSIHIILTIVQICYLLYPLVSTSLLQVFTCQELDDRNRLAGQKYSNTARDYLITGSYWTQNFDIKCWRGGHALLAKAVALPGVVLFSIGFPLITSLLLYHNRHKLGDHPVILMYGFLYEEYQPTYFFWEAVIMFRKAGLLVCTIFLRPYGAVIQLITVGIVTLICVMLQEIFRPFGNKVLNQLERVSLVSIALNVLFLGYFLPSSRIGETGRLVLTIVLILGNLLVALFFLACLVAVALVAVQGWLQSRGITRLSRSQIRRGIGVGNGNNFNWLKCGAKQQLQPVV